jgi:hypothetical protein
MEGSALFNPGFLGGSFLWWVGQIADDSTWRDNIVPGKFQSPETIPGWGRRYKVRIIGIHDKEETTIPSDQLPWANIMYPVTAGGGQTNASQTPNLRQGNFVFGFFLDGQDQQVPVIMGVLGNNAQTALKNKIGTTSSNFSATSGYAEGKDPPKGSAKPKVPDYGKVTSDPNKRPSINSPEGPIKPGPTKENPDAVHELGAADVKREEKYQEKIPLMKPDDKVGSAIKCIQTVIDNLVQKINKYLKAITSYIDAVSSAITSIQDLIANAACEIAKYMKIIFDKIMEYVLKLLNKTLTKVVAALPSSFRSKFADIKEIITELILCLYNKITAGLCGLIQDLLNKALKPDEAEKQARAQQEDSGCNKTPKTPICYAEEIVGQAISFSKQQIDEANNTILDNINIFLSDVQNQLAGVSGALSDITSLAGNISGSMSSALSFTNLSLNIFGCELKPNLAVSDFYTFGGGGASQPNSSIPNIKAVENAANKPSTGNPTAEIPYQEPTKATKDQIMT